MSLPNSLPRPNGEKEELERIWQPLRGFRILKAVNNTYIGLFYVGAALLFLVLGGVLALLMRAQLAFPGNDLVDYDTYNQLFTMHGSVMMFLFAVPVVEAIGILLLPAMLGARDLPFPRLSAFAFWAYFAGGLIFFCTLFFDAAPDGGWFMYPPLTSWQFSPGLRTDFWLLGIGFIEISAIAGAIEIVVGILRTRAPGMTLGKMPVYAWAMLVVGGMIVFAFPPVIVATALLELERAFHWPFFIADQGGDPVLWQHLFWLFGHPDVYIIFLPAAGLISMMVPTLARTSLVGYRWIVGSLIGTGVLSFALWVHHMFAIGMPHHAASFFSAASMAVAIPAAIQVFAWIATLWRGDVQRVAPTWFILGFFGIFVIGGLTGVMLAVVPFDWQAHDTYFVVAHLHYVLIGGLVFPILAAIYYWAPMVSGRLLSERMARWSCGLLFVGVNLTFFPMHIAGLLGMPRRIWTYREDLGWDTVNLLSSIGAAIVAIGFLIFILELIMKLRPARKVNVNPWNAPTLEWLPADSYATRSIPRVESREPLWGNPGIREEVDSGQHYLPGTATGTRETIVTNAIDAKPEYLLRLPGPSWLPFIAGLGTAAFFFLLTLKFLFAAAIAAAATLMSLIRWLWETDPAPSDRQFDVGGGVSMPDSMVGPRSHAWWAMVVLIIVDGSILASLVFSYFYLWDGAEQWRGSGASTAIVLMASLVVLAYVASSLIVIVADQMLRRGRRGGFAIAGIGALIVIGFALAQAYAMTLQLDDSPAAHAHGAIVYTMLAWQALHVLLLGIMMFYTLARLIARRLDNRRRSTFDHTRLMWHFTSVQGVTILFVSLTPTLIT